MLAQLVDNAPELPQSALDIVPDENKTQYFAIDFSTGESAESPPAVAEDSKVIYEPDLAAYQKLEAENRQLKALTVFLLQQPESEKGSKLALEHRLEQSEQEKAKLEEQLKQLVELNEDQHIRIKAAEQDVEVFKMDLHLAEIRAERVRGLLVVTVVLAAMSGAAVCTVILSVFKFLTL